MKFSIITPTRNCLKNVKRCVGSIRGQSSVIYEHKIQDACSTDGTAEWLKAQQDLDARSERDEGMYDAINRGWARSNGDILSWLNADEQYLPGTLAHVNKVFEENPDVDFAYGNAIIVDPVGRPMAGRREIPLRAFYIKNSFLNAYSCAMFFRRRLLDEGSLNLDTRYRYAADMDLILRLLASKAKHLHINRYLSLFGVDGNNLSSHDRMRTETEEIQAKFGGAKTKLAKRVVVLGRHVERLLAGAYKREVLDYDFVVDEAPTYCRIRQASVGGRYILPKQGDNQ